MWCPSPPGDQTHKTRLESQGAKVEEQDGWHTGCQKADDSKCSEEGHIEGYLLPLQAARTLEGRLPLAQGMKVLEV